MITDQTPARRALVTSETPVLDSSTARPRRKLRGSWRLPRRSSRSGPHRRPTEHLLLVGPSGGPVWKSRRP